MSVLHDSFLPSLTAINLICFGENSKKQSEGWFKKWKLSKQLKARLTP